MGRRMSRERRLREEKSSEQVDFEKSQAECTFKPNTDKPDLLGLSLKNR